MVRFQCDQPIKRLQPTTEIKHVAFGGHTCRINFQHIEAEKLLNFLFGEMLVDSPDSEHLAAHYEIKSHQNSWLVICDSALIAGFNEINAVGNFLSGDVLFKLIEPNNRHLAIHAGMVSQSTGSVLLPAESGSGKTSITAWLVKQGWQYHTDELVLIDLEGDNNQAFSRPLNIKSKGLAPVTELLGLDDSALEQLPLRQAEGITMMHQSLFAPAIIGQNRKTPPPVRTIIFPHHTAERKPILEPLTPAAAGLELMRSNVIARNLPGHGFTDVVNVVKKTPAYHLYYSHFDDLEALFDQVFHTW